MRTVHFRVVVIAFFLAALVIAPFSSTATRSSSIEDYKAQVAADVASMAKQSQVMVDMVFSFGELGFQEVETAKYLTGVLEKEGFKIERGIAGIPTAWVATRQSRRLSSRTTSINETMSIVCSPRKVPRSSKGGS